MAVRLVELGGRTQRRMKMSKRHGARENERDGMNEGNSDFLS